ncbi:glutathione S-transferase family protein [Fontimonas sp. SYSU GA230001]|uniref:glutathione S-transferase family protein n=1 Tax=Fontimonas sp. SYSU GA230001 TaxID=3142450 RepID=UPI0032B5B3A9
MIELWQFNVSMYPELVRWALDHKGLDYRARDLLPGPHVVQLLPRFGQKTVPVLRDGDRVLTQSLDILADLEARHPQHPLLPDDAAQREEVWRIVRHFADEYGPSVRLAAFHELLPHGTYMARVWAQPFSPLLRAAYVASFPLLVRPAMRADMGITAERAAQGRAATQEALDWVAARVRDRDYLVGDRFTLADLSVATVLFLTALAPEYPVRLPQPYPRGLQHWLDRWRGHPGTAWVRRMYGLHRRRAGTP